MLRALTPMLRDATTAPLRISVRVPSGTRERALAALLELAPGGLEEVEAGAEVELAAYGGSALLQRVRDVFPDAAVVTVEPGWEERWRTFHRAARAGGVWLGPPWETPPPSELAVVIDPGRAFGTGAHPTTRLCLDLLAGLERGSLLDIGCGSGVLAIAAARLGFAPIVAVDEDAVAVDVARENASRNHVQLAVRLADATSDELPRAQLAVANISLAAVEAILERLDVERAVTSGYLAHERPAALGWSALERRELDGWAADVLGRVR